MNVASLGTWLILAVILCILASLGMGLYYLLKDSAKTKRTVRALSFRIILSLVLFLMILFAFAMGWISPHSISG